MRLSNQIKKLTAALAILWPVVTYAQWFGTESGQIGTLRAMVGGDWQSLPVADMDQTIEFSFDEMSHEYHRFTYRIQHCDSRWNPSDILESEFLEGFNDQPVEEWENSLLTTFDYTHYRLTIPNSEVRLKLSGNYRLSICEDGREVAYFRFCLSENANRLTASVSGNTDIDSHGSHQQVNMSVNYSGLNVINPDRELYTVVMQNGRTDNAVHNPTPTYDAGNRLTYEHSRELIFPAGNEFRRFEVVNMYEYYMNVDRISFHDPFYHATLSEDLPRHAYQFDYDHNGYYLVRYNQASDHDTEADYLFVHFSLKTPRLDDGRLYVSGHFSGGNLNSRYEMEYNPDSKAYECTLLLKQGAYDYEYLWVPEGESKGQTKLIEGDWYETKNEYLILLYFRERGSRYDRLISVLKIEN